MSKDKTKSDLELSNHSLQILLNEYNQSNERIETFVNRQDNILQITFALIGASLAFTIVTPVAEEFLIIIPLIPLIVYIQIMYHYSRAIANQGYREYILELLNKYLPENEWIKYSFVAKKYLLKTNPMGQIHTILMPFAILVLLIYSSIMSNYNILVIAINIFLLVLSFLLGHIFYKFTINLNDDVKKFCKGI
jgi:hypothetical protein